MHRDIIIIEQKEKLTSRGGRSVRAMSGWVNDAGLFQIRKTDSGGKSADVAHLDQQHDLTHSHPPAS